MNGCNLGVNPLCDLLVFQPRSAFLPVMNQPGEVAQILSPRRPEMRSPFSNSFARTTSANIARYIRVRGIRP